MCFVGAASPLQKIPRTPRPHSRRYTVKTIRDVRRGKLDKIFLRHPDFFANLDANIGDSPNVPRLPNTSWWDGRLCEACKYEASQHINGLILYNVYSKCKGFRPLSARWGYLSSLSYRSNSKFVYFSCLVFFSILKVIPVCDRYRVCSYQVENLRLQNFT